MTPIGLPFEKEELETFLSGLESVNERLADQLYPRPGESDF